MQSVGVTLSLESSGHELMIPWSREDWDTIEKLRSFLPGAVEMILDETDLDEGVSLSLDDLSKAIDQIDEYLKDKHKLFTITYMFKCDDFFVGDQRIIGTFSTGGRSGFQLPGDETHWYSIWAGLDRCEMEKMARGPDGRGEIVESRDLRGVKEIQTSNCGVIRFRTRRTGTTLRKRLSRIRTFLLTLPADGEVTRIWC